MSAKLEIEKQHPEKDSKTEHNQGTENKLKERNLKFPTNSTVTATYTY